MESQSVRELQRACCSVKQLLLDLHFNARSGHVGSALSCAEVLTFLKFHCCSSKDTIILSKGHAASALYSVLAMAGEIDAGELRAKYYRDGTLFSAHPPPNKLPTIPFATGSLGHGFSFGVGFALSAKLDGKNHRVFVVLGDGECSEGTIWEAALSASKHKLDNLTILVDYNKQQTYGTIEEVQGLEPFADKWATFGFSVREVNGHDTGELLSVLGSAPFEPGRPNAIICHTVKGKGVSFTEKNLAWHHKSKVTDAEVGALMSELES